MNNIVLNLYIYSSFFSIILPCKTTVLSSFEDSDFLLPHPLSGNQYLLSSCPNSKSIRNLELCF